jgi:G:T/U-mismatch repair DNA glycosylase
MSIERHPFGYFVPQQAKYLLLGSFPCNRNLRNDQDPAFGEWFYCGSGKSAFWGIMELVFDTPLPAGDRAAKEQLMEKYGIAITDIALEIERKKNDCLDASLKILEYNTEVIQDILKNNPIETIFFTSRYVEKAYIKHIKPKDSTCKLEYLVSPSPAADMGLRTSEDFKNFIAQNPDKKLLDFRVAFYKERLPNAPIQGV